MPLCLHVPSHHAERSHGLPAPGQEPGDDGVERPLAGGQLVGMPRAQREPPSSVLQRDTRTGNDDPRSETREVGLDEADQAALVVGGAQIHGVGGTGIDTHRGPCDRTQATATGRDVRIGEQSCGGHIGMLRVGDEGVRVGERHLGGLQGAMPGTRARGGGDRGGNARPAERGHIRRVVAVEDPERHQRGDTLPVRRDLPDLVVAVGDADGVHPGGPVPGQVGGVESPTRAGRERHESFCGLAGVEVGPRAGAECPQGRRGGRAAPHLPDAGSATFRGEVTQELFLRRIRVRSCSRRGRNHGLGPRGRDDRGDRESFLGQRRGRLEQLGERQSSEPRVEVGPRPYCPRDRHRRPAVPRHLGVTPRAQVLGPPSPAGPTRSVEAVQAVPVPHQREGVRTEPVAGRLDDGQRGGGRDRRIHRVAAALQNGESRLRGDRLGGGDATMPHEQRLAASGDAQIGEVHAADVTL